MYLLMIAADACAVGFSVTMGVLSLVIVAEVSTTRWVQARRQSSLSDTGAKLTRMS